MTIKEMLLGTVGALTLAATAQAAEVTPLSEFDMSQYQDGWTAKSLLDAEVYGEDGDEVGEVENIVMTSEGKIDRLVIETDNWLGIGDRMISVPWNNVDLAPDKEGIVTRLDEDQMDDFSLFSDDDVDTGPQAFRASDLLGDYVELKDGTEYGYVSDIVFGQDGAVKAVMVNPDVGFGDSTYAGGYYGYPFYGYDYGLDPFADTYGLPYSEDEVAVHEPFDEDMFDNDIL